MKKKIIIKKNEVDFDITKIKEIIRADIFDDRIEFEFELEDG